MEFLQKNSESLFFAPSTIDEIRKLITELPSKRSSGPDNISNVLLKELAPILSEPLSIIVNQSMQTGIFPDIMKLAEVVPLYKGKSRENETNYRPISLLTTMSKVMEKVVYQRVYQFLTNTGQICETQYGFCSNHSCEHAIAQVIGNILKNLEGNESTIAVMLDLSKAFDTIEHRIMIQKLELFGVRGVCLDRFRSYLENRQMRVKCRVTSSQGETVSKYHTVNYGTPQGSCLGPLIFLFFVNDMRLHLTDVDSDDQLNWKTHMSRLFSKLKCCLGMLQRSSDLLSPTAKKLLYYSQVHSHLCYGLGVWGPMLSVGQTKELCTLQCKCVRLIDRKVPISEAFKRLQILRVMDLIELEQAKLGYKLCNRLLPTVLIHLMMHDYDNSTMVKSHSYQTRQKNIPNRPNAKLNLYRKSFLYQAIACYSKLDKQMRAAPTLPSFTKQLKKLIINNQY